MAVSAAGSTASSDAVSALVAAINQTGGSVARARTILARAYQRAAATYTLAASAPTVTLSAAGASSSISSAVQRAAKPALSNAFTPSQNADPTGDTAFRYLGLGSGITPTFGASNPDYYTIGFPYLTGGSAQSARWRPRIASMFYGQTIEYQFKATATSVTYRLTVNGARVTEDMQTLSGATSGSLHLIKVDFGSAALRRVELELGESQFVGAFIGPTDTLTRVAPGSLKLAAFGDSHTAGANGVGPYDAYPSRLADLLGCDEWFNLGIGGSAFNFASPGTGASDFRNRLSDIQAANPDVLLYFCGYNDAQNVTDTTKQATLQTEATTCLTAIRAALPECAVFVAGMHPSGTPTAATSQRTNAALKAAASATSCTFIDLLDPTGALSTAPTWAAGGTYPVGGVVLNGGALYVCTVSHTAAGSFDGTKFRALSWINGTGKSGSATGDGNADVLTSSDGIHMTLAGHKVHARRFADEIIRGLEAIVAAG